MRPFGLIAPGLALLLLTGPACDKQPPRRRAGTGRPAAEVKKPSRASQLRPWLKQVPSTARWAVASRDLQEVHTLLGDLWALWQKHPRLQAAGLELRKSMVRRWGGWPLDPKVWARLGLTRPGGGLVYRRADGVTVLAFRTRNLAELLQGISRAVQQLGARTIAPLRKSTVGSTVIWTVDEAWSCGLRGKVALCADVKPEQWPRVSKPAQASLWSGPLRRVPPAHLDVALGAWFGESAAPGRAAAAVAAGWTGGKASGLWTHLEPGRRLRLGAFLLHGTRRARSVEEFSLPKPGHSGLAAGLDAPLVLRLRLPPAVLLARLERLLPAARPVTQLLAHRGPNGSSLATELFNGELVLLSAPDGLAAVFGLRSQARGLRGLKTLSLLLAPRVLRWQKRIRQRGPGWDLVSSRTNAGELPGQRLTLSVPTGPGSPLPLLRDGKLELIWGLARNHLVVATNARLLRRIAARTGKPDRLLLRSLPGAAGRAAFERHHTVTLLLRPDDPFTSQPAAQRAVLSSLLDRLTADLRPWLATVRMALDLTAGLVLSVTDHPEGLAVRGVWDPVSAPGDRLRITPRYLAALTRKWGGNRDGYLTALRAIAATQITSAARRKARRLLARRKAVLGQGLVGLTAAALIPWLERRQRDAAMRRAGSVLDRLAGALTTQARRARSLQGLARRRWHRPLRSTAITPPNPCCSVPGRVCRSTSANWSHATWRRLGFSIKGIHRHRYQLVVARSTTEIRLTLRALGDLDCNGRPGIIERVGTVDTATGTLRFGPKKRIRKDD